MIALKTNIRAIGIDDSPFKFSDEEVMVVGNLTRAPNYLEGILSTHVEVDGTDATYKIIDMIVNSRFSDQAKVIFTDGMAVGGFNIIELDKLFMETNIPVISVSREEPDFETIKIAMQGHFDDWKDRFSLVDRGDIHEVDTPHKPIYIQVEGVELEEAIRMLKLFSIRGRLPEPLRISHIVASGIVRGESKGKP